MVQFLLASTSSSSLTQTMQAREASPGNVHGCLGLTCTFLHCHYTRMLQRQCGQATDLLSKPTLTAVIVQVTEQYNDPCLNSSVPQYSPITSSTTVLFCEHNNTLLSRAQTDRLATILLSTCCIKRKCPLLSKDLSLCLCNSNLEFL